MTSLKISPSDRILRPALLVLLFCLCDTVVSSAQTPAKARTWTAAYSTPSDSGALTAKLNPGTVTPGGKAELAITFTPDNHYHFYEYQENSSPRSGSTGLPTLIRVAPAKGVTVEKIHPSVEAEEKVDINGTLQRQYDGPVTFTVPLQIAEDAALGPVELRAGFSLQPCNENGCLLPILIELNTTLQVAAAAGAEPGEVKFAKMTSKAFKELTNPTSEAPIRSPAAPQENVAPAPPTPSLANPLTPLPNAIPLPDPAATESSAALPEFRPRYNEQEITSLGWAIGFSLIGGFLLNFMPCVLPVIGLKILSFVEQAGRKRSQILLLNLAYTAGMLSVFIAIALLVIATGFKWGEQFQSLGFNITLTALVFVMALSFLGVWEIPIPGFAVSKPMTTVASQQGYFGAFAKGILTTVLATACIGPFLGAVFGFLLGKPWITVLTVFMSIGVGMAMPYILLGVFPSLLRFLPKPGAWMETFKHLMGFVLMGTAVYLLSVVNASHLIATLVFLVGLGFACWWIGKVPVYESLSKRLRAWSGGIAVAALVGWFSFTALIAKERLQWEPYSHAKLLEYTRQGRTVMLDFTADWCANCQVNMAFAIDTEPVEKFVKQENIALLKADLSPKTVTDEHGEMLDALKRSAIPLLVVFPAGDSERPFVSDGVFTSPSQVVSLLRTALDEAKPTPNAARQEKLVLRQNAP